MALIECIECGKRFSEYAEACPECGCPAEVVKAAIQKREEAQKQEEERRLREKQEKERLALEKRDAERLAKEKEAKRKEKLLETFTREDLKKGRVLAELVSDTAIDNRYYHALITEDRVVRCGKTRFLDNDRDPSLSRNYLPTNVGQWMYMDKIYGAPVGIGLLDTYGITHSGHLARTTEQWNSYDHLIKHLTFGAKHVYMLGRDGRIYTKRYEHPQLNPQENMKLKQLPDFHERIGTWKNIAKMTGADETLCGIRQDGTCVVDGVTAPSVQYIVEGWTDLADVIVSDDTMGLHKDGTVVCANMEDEHAYDGWKGIIAIAKNASQYLGIRIDGALIDRKQNVIAEDCVGFCCRGRFRTLVVKADGSVKQVVQKKNKWEVSSWNSAWRVFEDLPTFVAKYKVSRDACIKATDPDALLDAKTELAETRRNYEIEMGSAGFMQKKKIEKKYDELIRQKKSDMQKLYKEPFPYDLKEYGSYADPFAAMKAMGDLYAGILTPKTKDASVIKRAAAGAVIAGPAGAVVGALSAVDKNNRNRK